MLLPILIRYVRLAAKRRGAIDVALSALVAVLVLSMGLLIIMAAGDAVPRDEILIALSR